MRRRRHQEQGSGLLTFIIVAGVLTGVLVTVGRRERERASDDAETDTPAPSAGEAAAPPVTTVTLRPYGVRQATQPIYPLRPAPAPYLYPVGNVQLIR